MYCQMLFKFSMCLINFIWVMKNPFNWQEILGFYAVFVINVYL